MCSGSPLAVIARAPVGHGKAAPAFLVCRVRHALVDVVRILHGARDLERYIKRP